MVYHRITMIKTLSKHGNSQALVLSKDLLALLGVEEGGSVRIAFEGRKMIVTPAHVNADDEEFDRAMERILDANAAALSDLAK